MKYRRDRFLSDLPVRATGNDELLGEGRLRDVSETGGMVSGLLFERDPGLVTLTIGREHLKARVARSTAEGTAFAFVRRLGAAELAKLKVVQSRGRPVYAHARHVAGRHGFREMD